MTELDLRYPRDWAYRIIGTHEKLIRQLVADILADQPYELAASNESATGRYVSLHLRVEVRDEDHRNEIFGRLVADEAVRIVL